MPGDGDLMAGRVGRVLLAGQQARILRIHVAFHGESGEIDRGRGIGGLLLLRLIHAWLVLPMGFPLGVGAPGGLGQRIDCDVISAAEEGQDLLRDSSFAPPTAYWAADSPAVAHTKRAGRRRPPEQIASPAARH